MQSISMTDRAWMQPYFSLLQFQYDFNEEDSQIILRKCKHQSMLRWMQFEHAILYHSEIIQQQIVVINAFSRDSPFWFIEFRKRDKNITIVHSVRTSLAWYGFIDTDSRVMMTVHHRTTQKNVSNPHSIGTSMLNRVLNISFHCARTLLPWCTRRITNSSSKHVRHIYIKWNISRNEDHREKWFSREANYRRGRVHKVEVFARCMLCTELQRDLCRGITNRYDLLIVGWNQFHLGKRLLKLATVNTIYCLSYSSSIQVINFSLNITCKTLHNKAVFMKLC